MPSLRLVHVVVSLVLPLAVLGCGSTDDGSEGGAGTGGASNGGGGASSGGASGKGGAGGASGGSAGSPANGGTGGSPDVCPENAPENASVCTGGSARECDYELPDPENPATTCDVTFTCGCLSDHMGGFQCNWYSQVPVCP